MGQSAICISDVLIESMLQLAESVTKADSAMRELETQIAVDFPANGWLC
ncbi:MAG: hypothetical protein ACTHXN_01435 [Oceanisphaera sp.]